MEAGDGYDDDNATATSNLYIVSADSWGFSLRIRASNVPLYAVLRDGRLNGKDRAGKRSKARRDDSMGAMLGGQWLLCSRPDDKEVTT